MSDTIEVNGITFTKEKPTKAGYYLTADVLPKATWVHVVAVEPEYNDTKELGCWVMMWKPVSELDYYWHRLVPEQDLAAVTKERDALRVHCTIADQGLDEMYGLTTRLGEAAARIKRLEEAGDDLAKIIGPPGSDMWADEPESDRAYLAWTQAKEAR